LTIYLYFVFGLILFLKPFNLSANPCNVGINPSDSRTSPRAIACAFDVLPGELVTVNFYYAKKDPYNPSINNNDYVDVIFSSDYQRKRIYQGEQGEVRYIATNAREEVSYELSNYNEGDFLNIQAISQRGNVFMIDTYIRELWIRGKKPSLFQYLCVKRKI
jgi:hypothetical protein